MPEDRFFPAASLRRAVQVHLGGDEVVPDAWTASPLAREVMAREGLAYPSQLAGYFIGRVAAMAGPTGRDIIGWDEILGAALPPSATVMSWLGFGGGVVAAQRDLDTVMTPSSICYLERCQADPATEPMASGKAMPLAAVYGFEPIREALIK